MDSNWNACWNIEQPIVSCGKIICEDFTSLLQLTYFTVINYFAYLLY